MNSSLVVNTIEIFRPTCKNLRKSIKKTTIHNDENKMSFEIHYKNSSFVEFLSKKILAFLGRWDFIKQWRLQQVGQCNKSGFIFGRFSALKTKSSWQNLEFFLKNPWVFPKIPWVFLKIPWFYSKEWKMFPKFPEFSQFYACFSRKT